MRTWWIDEEEVVTGSNGQATIDQFHFDLDFEDIPYWYDYNGLMQFYNMEDRDWAFNMLKKICS